MMQEDEKNGMYDKSDNELLAKFMGDKELVSKKLLLYHSSWNWLINVVKKCRSVCRGKWNDKSWLLYNDIEEALLTFDIAKTYKAAAEFVRWYITTQSK